MDPHPEDAPLCVEDADRIRELREVFERVKYSETHILDVLGVREMPPASTRVHLLPLLRHRTEGTALGDLLRLFLLGDAVPLKAFRRAIEPQDPEEWTALGLVQGGADEVTATVQLFPYAGLILAADWPGRPAGMGGHVMEVGGSSRTLVDFTIRRRSRRTLDLGTGCGVQGLLAAGHSDRVWAIDSNPRALNLARFGARLNGLFNVHFAEGDLFEPVRDQVFDLVLGNLPFVISPESQYLYCQGGGAGDAFCRRVIREVPAVLREGGCCQLVSDLAHIKGEDFGQRLAGWFEGTGCDAWVLYSLTLDPATYAARWLRETDGRDLNAQSERFDAWMDYYEKERIEAISFSLIALRRATGRKNWFRCEEAKNARTPSGDEVVLKFALRDFLETVGDDAALLGCRLHVSPGLRWDQELEPTTDGWMVAGSRLRAADTGADGGPADPGVLFLVARCRGERPLRDILTELAGAVEQPLETILPDWLPRVRRLIEQGFLLPAGGPR